MARTPRNRTHINITDANSTTEYLNKFSGMNITAAGGYSKNINDEGWVTQSGGFGVSNQGLVKATAWAVVIISQRAKEGDIEARNILSNLGHIVVASSKIDVSKLSASVELKQEGNVTESVEKINEGSSSEFHVHHAKVD
jgi:hypothetical protein